MATSAPRPPKPPATLADLENLPVGSSGQILDGELIVQPRPAPRHLRVTTSLGGELAGPFDRRRGGPGGWVLLRWNEGSYLVQATHEGEETARAQPFDAIELELPVLWRT